MKMEIEMEKEIEIAENHSPSSPSSDDECELDVNTVVVDTLLTDDEYVQIVVPKTDEELKNIEEILKTNGKSIKHLSICNHNNDNLVIDDHDDNQWIHRLMKLITKYCPTEGQITQLDLKGISQLEDVFHLPSPFFRLHILKMDSCNLRMFFNSDIFSSMTMWDFLKELEINNAIVDENNVEEMTAMNETFKDLMKNTNGVEKLSICNSNMFDSEIFNNLSPTLKSLQFVHNKIEDMDTFHKNIKNMITAKNLKELKLSCSFTSIADCLDSLTKENIELETLHLTDVLIDTNMIDKLSKMTITTNMKELKLYNIRFYVEPNEEELPTTLVEKMLFLSTPDNNSSSDHSDSDNSIELTAEHIRNKSILVFQFDKLCDDGGAKVTIEIKLRPLCDKVTSE